MLELSIGQILAFTAVFISTILAGFGSARGVGLAGQTSAGVSTENPEVSSKLMVLQILPGTQGIYGFLIGVIILVNIGALGGELKALTLNEGLLYIASVLPVAIVGYLSAMLQSKVASAAMLMVGQQPDMSGKAITMTVMVETYAVLALLISFILVNSVA